MTPVMVQSDGKLLSWF